VIKEIAVMDTLPITSPVAAALALANVLGRDLPASDYITVKPSAVHRSYGTAIDLQFSGAHQLEALHAWATHFGVTVEMPDSVQGFAHVYFTHCGVRFACYAQLGTDAS
jgi:hypothetical protein